MAAPTVRTTWRPGVGGRGGDSVRLRQFRRRGVKMAARKIMRLGAWLRALYGQRGVASLTTPPPPPLSLARPQPERQSRWTRPTPPRPQRISQWRVAQGWAPSTSGYGPLRDLPDWSFVDGRPAPLWKGQQRRLQENEALARRALKLSQALDGALQRGTTPRGGRAPPIEA
ncbi:large ribosomal subunit protein mL52 [Guaruba guarouba]